MWSYRRSSLSLSLSSSSSEDEDEDEDRRLDLLFFPLLFLLRRSSSFRPFLRFFLRVSPILPNRRFSPAPRFRSLSTASTSSALDIPATSTSSSYSSLLDVDAALPLRRSFPSPNASLSPPASPLPRRSGASPSTAPNASLLASPLSSSSRPNPGSLFPSFSACSLSLSLTSSLTSFM